MGTGILCGAARTGVPVPMCAIQVLYKKTTSI